MNDQLKEILISAASVVLLQRIFTCNSGLSIVDNELLNSLDKQLASYFQLDSGDINFENMDDLVSKIRNL